VNTFHVSLAIDERNLLGLAIDSRMAVLLERSKSQRKYRPCVQADPYKQEAAELIVVATKLQWSVNPDVFRVWPDIMGGKGPRPDPLIADKANATSLRLTTAQS
jgi:hypothetical protein